jgi:hypothetical protein
MKSEAEKPATVDTVNGLWKSEQLGRRLISRSSEPTPQKQGWNLQIILVVWSLAAIVSAWFPK